MPISAKKRSLHGTSGPDEMPQEELDLISNEPTPTSESEITPRPVDSSPASAGADVPVAGNSAEPKPSLYSATDAKLASRMTREIAQNLGLSGKSRSVRI